MKPSMRGVLLVLALAALLSGCPNPQPPIPSTPTATPTGTAIVTPTSTPSPTVTPGGGNVGISTGPEDPEGKMKDVTYIYPGKVNVDGLYPGAEADFLMKVHNGKSEAAPFVLSAYQPGSAAQGYQPMPAEYLSWVSISDANPTVPPKESKDVTITIKLPANIQVSKKSYELWIVVKDVSQTEFVQTQLALRCLITIR